MSLAFRKGHGTGNDFVVVTGAQLSDDRVRRICHRRGGIGADGVLNVVTAAQAQRDVGTADWFMDHRNADGSKPEMCGNGARLFARHLVDIGAEQTGTFTIATRGGVRSVVVPKDGDIEVEMGRSEFSMLRTTPYVGIGDRQWPAVAVSVPNPHAVAFVDDLSETDPFDTAPMLVPPGVFPDGANVEFAVVSGPRSVTMRVWERGVGLTQSCGTGAIAVAAAAAQRDGVVGEVNYDVKVPGGLLRTRRDAADIWYLAGPAVFVADGTTSL